MSRLDSSFDSLTRCASPPDSVVALWPQANVGQTDIHQGLQSSRQHWDRIEELACVLDRHLQYFVDALALVFDLQCFAVVALALAHIARHVDIGQEVHLDLDHAVALAGFTPAAFDVEAEATRLVAARTRFLSGGEQLADRGEDAGVGRRI